MMQYDSPQRRYGPLSDMLSGVRYVSGRPETCDGDFFHSPVPDKFCGRWNAADLVPFFSDTGCMAHWASLGYHKIWVEIDPVEIPNRYGMSVWTNVGQNAEILMLLVVWLDYLHIDRLQRAFPSFGVEHLLLQSPGCKLIRPLLPGQECAPSGLLRRIFGILRMWACMLGAQVISEIPQYFHTAHIFSEYFTYADTEMEGLFRAICRDLLPSRNVADVSRAFEAHRVLYNGQPWIWPTEVQVCGLSHDLSALLAEPRTCLDSGRFSMQDEC